MGQSSEGPSLRLVSIRWERIQLVIELRSASGAPVPDVASIRMRRREGGRQAEMVPTGSETDAETGTLRLRFNVMQGPGQRPLKVGRWALSALVQGDPDVPRHAARAFEFQARRYHVTPSLDATGSTLVVAIDRPRRSRSVHGPARRPIPPAFLPLLRIRRRWLIRAGRFPHAAFTAAVRRTTRRSGRRIVFASAGSRELSGNLRLVHDRMIDRGLDREYELRTLLRPAPGRRSGRIRSVLRAIRQQVREIRLLASADVVLVAGSLQRAVYRLRFDSDVRFIQLWHASGAFKTVGYSRIGTASGPDPYSRVHKSYTHAIVSSVRDIPYYAEAFGIPEGRVVPTGIPRMDRFFDAEKQAEGRAAALEAFPAAQGRRTILFAPTYRGWSRAAVYDYEQIDFAAFHEIAKEQDAQIIFKMHPFVRQPVPIPAAYADRLIDGTRTKVEVNDLLFIVDLLITDYSSLVFEYATLGRPMLFFAYDLDEYIAERDFYVPFESFVPGRIVRTSAELIDALRRADYQADKVASFAERHFDHLDAGSTDRVIDLALGL